MTAQKLFLVPVDFSNGSRTATDYALRLARRSGAEVVLLSVFDLPVYAAPLSADPDGGQAPPSAAFIDEIRQGLQRDLDTLVTELGETEVPVRAMLTEGVAAASIVRTAEELGASMIIMGTHGRTGLAHLLIGSVTERVVRTAGRPVLTVPLPREA